MGGDDRLLGIADVIERLRADLTESQRRLEARKQAVEDDPAVQQFKQRQEEISHATFVTRQEPPPPLPRPVELAQLDAPLTLQTVTVELEFVVETAADGGIDLKVVSAGGGRTYMNTHRITLQLHTPRPMDIGG
jgi:hypothetical protein